MKTRFAFPLLALSLALTACGGEWSRRVRRRRRVDGKADSATAPAASRPSPARTARPTSTCSPPTARRSSSRRATPPAGRREAGHRDRARQRPVRRELPAPRGAERPVLLQPPRRQLARSIATSEIYVTKSNAERAIDRRRSASCSATKVRPPPRGDASRSSRASTASTTSTCAPPTARSSSSPRATPAAQRPSPAPRSVRANGADARRYQVKDAANGQAYFVARRHQRPGHRRLSETYVTRSNAERGASTVATILQSESIAHAQ